MNLSKEQWEMARQQMENVDSDQILSQARMLRNMDKNTVRRMNPQMAQMSDSQIDSALTQMEMMASNPAMMRMAQQQMATMSHEQAAQQMAAAMPAGGAGRAFATGDRVKLYGLAKAAEHNGKLGTVVGLQGERFKVQLDGENKTLALKEANLEKVSAAGPPAPAAAAAARTMPVLDETQMREAQRQMEDPEGMREQARALRTTPPDVIRSSNPAMAHMSDEQIKSAANQLEMMANNPEMLEMASKSMANMTPAQLESMQKMMAGGGPPPSPGAAAPGVPAGPPDVAQAAKMMENMDESQLESVLNVVKENPEMVKNMLRNNPMMAGMSPEMVDKQLEMLDKVPPEQLKRMLTWATKANKFFAPVASTYAKLDRLLGGRLKHLLLASALALLAALVTRLFSGFFLRASNADPPAVVEDIVQAVQQASVASLVDEDDEFADPEPLAP